MPLISMTTAEGQRFAIPGRAIVALESIRAGKVEQYVNYTTLVRFDIGQGMRNAFVNEDFDDLTEKLRRDRPDVSMWRVLLVGEEDWEGKKDRIFLEPNRIHMVEGLDPDLKDNFGCSSVITVDLGYRNGTNGVEFVKFPLLEKADDVLALLN